MNMHIEELFPTPTWGFDLNENLDEIRDWIVTLHQNDPEGKHASNYGGWQSKSFYDCSDTPLKSLAEFIEGQIPMLCETMGFPTEGRKLLNLWVNMNPKFAYNLVHVHTEAKFSGVFYVNVNENSGDFAFVNPQFYKSETHTPTKYTCSEVRCKPQNNKLLIFPAWIQHHVLANLSDDVRVSISFNII
jgi:uncharacterized protein (TIGR02466 family)|tara:strand:+ start:126 stop:689 length:564 start_codon:yes stop_codon:yes gene_type:complete